MKYFLVMLLVLWGCSVEVSGSDQDENVTPFVLTKINHQARDSNDLYKSIKNIFTEEEIKKIVYVLKYYNEDHVVREKKIYISLDLAKDLDLLANYSKKAFDDKWVKSR